MAKPKILVTGATGKTGSLVVSELLCNDYPVRAMVHRDDDRARRLAALGADIVVADMCDFDRVSDALKGVQRACYVPPFDPNMLQGASVFATAAQGTAGLEHIVGLTQWLAHPSHPALMTRQLWLAGRLFEMVANVGLTIVNPGFFADAYLQLIPFASLLGIFPLPVDGESRNAPPSNEDIARVAAASLSDPRTHAGKTYRPTGPRLLSVNEMVQVMGVVLRRRILHVKSPLWMLYKTARGNGNSEMLLNSLRHYFKDHDQGAFAHGAPTNDIFEVTGHQPEDFETIVRRYAALPVAQPTVSNRLVAFGRFMATPFMKGFDPGRFDRELRSSRPAVAQLATESVLWRLEHGVAEARSLAMRPNGGTANLDSHGIAKPIG